MEVKNIHLLCVCSPDVIQRKEVIEEVFKNGMSFNEVDWKKPIYNTWKVDNKYFTADVNVCFCPEQCFEKLYRVESNDIEAFLLISNMNDANSFLRAKHMISKIADRNVEICLLYNVETVSDEQLKEEVLLYCIDNGFEFVERSLENCKKDEDDGLQEKFGLDRIVEALNSHVWSCHIMKVESSSLAPSSSHENMTSHVMFNDDSSFHELFGKFMSMKEKAKSLGDVERKAYAEKVALAFMDALGIDDEDGDE